MSQQLACFSPPLARSLPELCIKGALGEAVQLTRKDEAAAILCSGASSSHYALGYACATALKGNGVAQM